MYRSVSSSWHRFSWQLMTLLRTSFFDVIFHLTTGIGKVVIMASQLNTIVSIVRRKKIGLDIELEVEDI